MNQELKDCQGIVKWWSWRKGYGFITTSHAPGIDVMVHHSDIVDDGSGDDRHKDLYKDQHVRFDLVKNVINGRYKGMKAINVKESK